MAASGRRMGESIVRRGVREEVNVIKGIPTTYEGVNFRSRTEAAFAAFFERVGWNWEYEPVDLEGYIPDFIVRFPAGPLLLEIKGPVEEVALAESKVEVSGWNREALILCAPNRTPEVGRLLEWHDGEPLWGQAELFRCLSCGEVSVLCRELSWRCRACGDGWGNAHVGDYDPAEDWAHACNRVQWRAAV